jgi:hypothetical protein
MDIPLILIVVIVAGVVPMTGFGTFTIMVPILLLYYPYFTKGARLPESLLYGLPFFIAASFLGAAIAGRIVDRIPQKHFRKIVGLCPGQGSVLQDLSYSCPIMPVAEFGSLGMQGSKGIGTVWQEIYLSSNSSRKSTAVAVVTEAWYVRESEAGRYQQTRCTLCKTLSRAAGRFSSCPLIPIACNGGPDP